jgi:ABC-2 type transport system permease protein
MMTLRLLWVGVLMQLKMSTRGTFEIATAMVMPVVQATMAVYLLRAADSPHRMVVAAVGAGLMGVWSNVLFGSGGAIQRQRFGGTLEMLILAPRNPAITILPITISTGLTGVYSMGATLAWGWLIYGIKPEFANPWAFLIAVPACIVGLGMFGLLMASTFVVMRNANALCNTLEYPIWLLSGMLVPMTVLPAWTGPVAAILPTTWGARAVHEAVSGGAVWPAVAWCLGISFVCFLLGAISMSFVERRARAAATLALS